MSSRRIRTFPPNPNSTRGTSTKLGSSGDKIIYANGKSIVIRDLSNSANDIVYSGHVQPTTVARISPSGYYAASADAQGNVRIWDTVGEDQVLKAEYKVLGGKVNDLSWDGESKRIIAVGDGREKFGHVFQFDTGSSAGEIVGHAKALNAVAIRHQRPFRAATAGDDGLIVFHTGAPYKYDKTLKAHSKFVHSVAYADSGTHFVSVGADAKVFLWDGVSGERVAEFVDGGDAHKGSVYGGAWGPDSKSIVTSSADCTVKLWDVETRKATTIWTVGSSIGHQQMGNTWTSRGTIVSLSMGGLLNVFDPREGVGPVKIIHGPQKAITSASISTPSSTFFAGSADGRVYTLSTADVDGGGVSGYESVSGSGHTNLVSGIASAGDTTWSVGFDDVVREVEVKGEGVQRFSDVVYGPTASQPKCAAVSDDRHVFVAEAGHVEVLRSGQRVCSVEARYGAISVDVSAGMVAVGGEDSKVHLYNWNSNGTLTAAGMLEGSKGPVSSLAFAPDGSLLAVGDSTGKIIVYDVKERKATISRWTFHNSRIHSLAWTMDGAHVASGSLDTHVYVWSVAKPMRNIAIKNAGPGGVWGVRWVSTLGGGSADSKGTAKLLSAGADGAVRMWEIVFHV